MNAAFIMIALMAMLAIGESETFRPRSASDQEELQQSIQTACIDPLNLTPEESAAMEKIWELQQSDTARAQHVIYVQLAYSLSFLLKESEEDFEKVLGRVTPNQAVAHSLKPKILMFLVCTSDETMKALNLQR